MSINNLSSPAASSSWWKQNHSTCPNPNPNNSTIMMFEKPLTPSDVGKLNRLVIPKQYAEKYFPLREKPGMLLCLEDDEISGKFWRFRYSYWSSSQSYVLTKGWSRFVKEKKLQAGDVVLFHRHSLHSHRKFIGWRRPFILTPPVAQPPNTSYPAQPPLTYPPQNLPSVSAGGSAVFRQENGNGNGNVSNKKQFRLFGVDLDLSCEPQGQSDHSQHATSSDGSSSTDSASCYSSNVWAGL